MRECPAGERFLLTFGRFWSKIIRTKREMKKKGTVADMTEGVTLRKGRLMPAEDSKYYFYCKTFWYSTVIACLITIPFIIYEWVVTGHGIYL